MKVLDLLSPTVVRRMKFKLVEFAMVVLFFVYVNHSLSSRTLGGTDASRVSRRNLRLETYFGKEWLIDFKTKRSSLTLSRFLFATLFFKVSDLMAFDYKPEMAIEILFHMSLS